MNGVSSKVSGAITWAMIGGIHAAYVSILIWRLGAEKGNSALDLSPSFLNWRTLYESIDGTFARSKKCQVELCPIRPGWIFMESRTISVSHLLV